MRISFSTTACPDWTLEQIARNAQQLGYDGVELRVHHTNAHFSPAARVEEAKKLGAYFRYMRVPIFSLKSSCGFSFADPDNITSNQNLMRRLLALADAIGARHVRACVGIVRTGLTHRQTIDIAVSALKPLAAEAHERNIKIGIETHDDWCFGEYLVQLVQSVDSEHGIGIIYDVYDCYERGIETWLETYNKVRSRLCYCQLKDGVTNSHGLHSAALLGAGDLPIHRILRQFYKDEFHGYLNFDWDKRLHPQLEKPEVALPHFVRTIRSIWEQSCHVDADRYPVNNRSKMLRNE